MSVAPLIRVVGSHSADVVFHITSYFFEHFKDIFQKIKIKPKYQAYALLNAVLSPVLVIVML